MPLLLVKYLQVINDSSKKTLSVSDKNCKLLSKWVMHNHLRVKLSHMKYKTYQEITYFNTTNILTCHHQEHLHGCLGIAYIKILLPPFDVQATCS